MIHDFGNNRYIDTLTVFESNATLTWPLEIKQRYGENNETYIIELLAEPRNTTLQVNIKFISQLSNTLQGFYRVGYNDIDTTDKK